VAARQRNVPAEGSLLLATAGLAILVVRSYVIFPNPFGILVTALVPGCGLAASAAGIVGIRRARAADGPTVVAVLGLLGGLGLLFLCVAALLLLWAISRSNWQF
jgi:tellurite resistance protein TehA-like permease